MVHAGEVNQRVFPQRANQRRFWRPFLILREEGFGNLEIRIDLLDVQILAGERIGILGWPEIPRLPLTHRAAILDNNHVARGTPRRDLLTLRLHVARPGRWVGDNGADADAEYFQQFAAAHLFNSFSHVFLLTSNLKNSITSLING